MIDEDNMTVPEKRDAQHDILIEPSTIEEKRVPVYFGANGSTVGHLVTATTPLEELNLNWREKDLPQYKRTKHIHGLHPYLGKYIPQLVEIFLRKYFLPGQIVYDPFCGSGTTLVQANELGINSVGCDISAFNVLLSKVKTGQYDVRRLEQEIYDVLEKTQAITQKETQISLLTWKTEDLSLPSIDDEYLTSWYAPQALRELQVYLHLVQSQGYEYEDVLKIILTRAARSARLTTHFDLDFPREPQREPYWCYKHSRECYPVQEAFKFLKRYSKDTLKRITHFVEVRTDAKVEIHHADSRELDVEGIDGIITSPPYVGLIDYHEQHVYAYKLLNLEDRSNSEIGPAAGGSSNTAKEQYQQDIISVFEAASKPLRSGGYIIVVAGDKHGLYDNIAKELDVKIEGIVQRHVNRRTGRRSSEFYESVFIWRKL